ncbi:MAG: GNAT family acetyltransferase [Gammaproteobacteria bacterium]|nr:MAG: GNAT family acetyltransferase [Gammaproteobacteria bacterium]
MFHVRSYQDSDFAAVLTLWEACDLVRAWNPPAGDIALCRNTASSELFVGVRASRTIAETLIATVMTGSDGHRGWLYYLAVDPASRGEGLARAMVGHAEDWLAGHGIRKVELMIRDDNIAVRDFYARIGYQPEARVVMSRWLERDE